VHYQMNKQWSTDSSLVVYWFNPGGEDYGKYIRQAPGKNVGYYNLGGTGAFQPSYELNFGVQCDYSKNLTLRVDVYNVLGWIEERLCKRRVGFNGDRPGEYRIMPSALGFQLMYKF
jgi:hypothetical protein